ncbi:tRNA1(Val) (adenine(37)-N6)-methyltransferase [Bradyrhizobium sp.]|jgi:tRNA1(Val) A37 N6-methylase TrmN6|uniref:tRNA1(Val) (adenine(37)-N6)-methyltransferase n=1 Tax=Bradyrhizobium sp. TaxID=376 RepID=UPI002E01BA63|nr:methyltransferase [Bradyrhizobium sp.]
MTELADEFTEDAFLGGRLRLRQPKSGHRAGHDAVLLAAATAARAGDRVVDFGAGVGAAGLALATHIAGIEIVLVEIDKRLVELARGNAALNRIEARIIAMDLASGTEAFAGAGLAPDSVDVVLMNPPFNDPSRHRSSPDQRRKIAHLADAATLQSWLRAARRILKSGGVLTLIWRADGLAEVLAALDRGFGSLAILPVHGSAATPAIRVLVRAIKGGRAPTALYPGLMLNDESGLPNKQVQEILAGRGNLPLAVL